MEDSGRSRTSSARSSAETVTLTLMYTIREAMDEAIRAGVPEEAARDFLLGRINVNMGILFCFLGIDVSDGAKRAVERDRGGAVKLALLSYTCAWAFGIPGRPQPASPLTHEGLVDLAAAKPPNGSSRTE